MLIECLAMERRKLSSAYPLTVGFILTGTEVMIGFQEKTRCEVYLIGMVGINDGVESLADISNGEEYIFE